MAIVTLTATAFNQPAKFIENGVVSVSGNYNSGANAIGTLGDTLFLCKIPHGATILSIREDHSNGATSCIWSIGMSTGGAAGGGASLSAFAASAAPATVNNGIAGSLPFLVSCSDLDPNRYGIFSMSAPTGASATTSLIVNFVVMYRCDGSPS